MRVEEAYRPGTLTCDAADPLLEVARKMVSDHVGALAVVEDNEVVGIISERDVVRAAAQEADLRTTTSSTFASHRLKTATTTEDTLDVARRMLDAGIRHLPVVHGQMVIGVISMRDLLAVEAWT